MNRQFLSRRSLFALGVSGLAAAVVDCGSGGEDRALASAPFRPAGGESPAGGSREPWYLSARPGRPGSPTPPGGGAGPGPSPLGLGGERDGFLHVPAGYRPGSPAPLMVMLHGATQSSSLVLGSPLQSLADEVGFLLLAPDSRGGTWDLIARQRFGPDVAFLDRVLGQVFARHAVDLARVALAGFSDGASYALSLGPANGDLFSHLIAFSPGFASPPARQGSPRIYVSHGTRDRILPIETCSRRIVPRLQADGYDVLYREFDGPHGITPEIAREAVGRFAGPVA